MSGNTSIPIPKPVSVQGNTTILPETVFKETIDRIDSSLKKVSIIVSTKKLKCEGKCEEHLSMSHLLTSAYNYSVSNPLLSSSLIRSFDKFAIDSGTPCDRLHEVCSHCGLIMILGINASVHTQSLSRLRSKRILSQMRSKRHEDLIGSAQHVAIQYPTSEAVFTCGLCHEQTRKVIGFKDIACQQLKKTQKEKKKIGTQTTTVIKKENEKKVHINGAKPKSAAK